MRMFLLLLSVAAVSLLPALAAADGFVKVPVQTTDNGNTLVLLGHMMYTPPGFDASGDDLWPVIVNLHGDGERGEGGLDDLEILYREPLLKRIVANQIQVPAVIITPQRGRAWRYFPDTIEAIRVEAVENYRGDPERVYVVGLSGGGGPLWGYISHPLHASKIAAAIPICGIRSPPHHASALGALGTPIWVAHNWGDGKVLRSNSITWASALARGRARLPDDDTTNDLLNDYPHVNGDPSLPASSLMTAQYDDENTGWVWGANFPSSKPSSTLLFSLGTSNSHDAWTMMYFTNADVVFEWLFSHRRPVDTDPTCLDQEIHDTSDATFVGSWSASTEADGYYTVENNYYHDKGSNNGRRSVSYPFNGASGTYTAWIWYPAASNSASGVPVDIYNGDGSITTIVINQNEQGSSWLQLGENHDLSSGVSKVVIRNEVSGEGNVIADAIRYCSVPSVPSGWTCAATLYGGDTCECDCGIEDPACTPPRPTVVSAYHDDDGLRVHYDHNGAIAGVCHAIEAGVKGTDYWKKFISCADRDAAGGFKRVSRRTLLDKLSEYIDGTTVTWTNVEFKVRVRGLERTCPRIVNGEWSLESFSKYVDVEME